MNIDERLNNLENKINILSQNLNNSNKRLFGFEKIIIIKKKQNNNKFNNIESKK